MNGKDGEEMADGIDSEKLPELSLSMDNDKLAKLTKKWEKKWVDSTVYSEWKEKGKENEKYWLGKHFDRPQVARRRPIIDNAIFESLETYLPQVTKRNPEPVIELHKSVEDQDNKGFLLEFN